MTVWTRATMAMRCGACPRIIACGEPYLEIQIGGMKRKLHRCQFCAGGSPLSDPTGTEDRGPNSPNVDE